MIRDFCEILFNDKTNAMKLGSIHYRGPSQTSQLMGDMIKLFYFKNESNARV